jgi:hypothetical protein
MRSFLAMAGGPQDDEDNEKKVEIEPAAAVGAGPRLRGKE